MGFDKFTKTAVKAALEGGKVLKYYYDRQVKVELKGKIDPVTIADKTSQKVVFKTILKSFPKHTVIGEEDKEQKQCAEYCWIVDPLDGTVNFIHKVPLFCVSVAMLHKGEVISGAIYAPIINELFVAQKGAGAFLNGKKISVSKAGKLVSSLAVTGFPYDVHSKSDRVLNNFKNVLKNAQGVRRLGSAAIDLSWVACGRFDAFWEEGLKPWDVAAGSLIVKEAGGAITDFSGSDNYVWGNELIASNGRIQKDLLKIIKK
jgi:myo-inositol-1(or 4)-monophosphatase